MSLMPRKVQVLQEDIDTCRFDRQGDPRRCMLDTAVQRSIPAALHPDSDIRYIRFSLESTQKRYFYDTPQKAMRALLDFDAGRPVKPFTFTMSRGRSEVRRSKQNGFIRNKKRYPLTGKRRQAPRKRQFGLHAFTEDKA